MHKSLTRIFKLRKLTEEMRRNRLARDAQALAGIEECIFAWEQAGTESRERGFDGATQMDREGWLLAVAEQELASWQRAVLLPLQAEAEARVDLSREEFLESRQEKRQAETLLERRLASANEKASRRQQI